MDEFTKYYYCFLAGLLVAGLGWYAIGAWLHSLGSTEHFMAVNYSHINDTHCQTLWLGGWDYDSFVRDIRVNGVSVGHPRPYTKIQEGRCNESVLVEVYDKPVQTYLTLWDHTGVILIWTPGL